VKDGFQVFFCFLIFFFKNNASGLKSIARASLSPQRAFLPIVYLETVHKTRIETPPLTVGREDALSFISVDELLSALDAIMVVPQPKVSEVIRHRRLSHILMVTFLSMERP
jgi:hypothetical protein